MRSSLLPALVHSLSGEKSNLCLQRWKKEDFTANMGIRWRFWPPCKVVAAVWLHQIQSGKSNQAAFRLGLQSVKSPGGGKPDPKPLTCLARNKKEANPVGGANIWLVLLTLKVSITISRTKLLEEVNDQHKFVRCVIRSILHLAFKSKIKLNSQQCENEARRGSERPE